MQQLQDTRTRRHVSDTIRRLIRFCPVSEFQHGPSRVAPIRVSCQTCEPRVLPNLSRTGNCTFKKKALQRDIFVVTIQFDCLLPQKINHHHQSMIFLHFKFPPSEKGHRSYCVISYQTLIRISMWKSMTYWAVSLYWIQRIGGSRCRIAQLWYKMWFVESFTPFSLERSFVSFFVLSFVKNCVSLKDDRNPISLQDRACVETTNPNSVKYVSQSYYTKLATIHNPTKLCVIVRR